MKLKRLIISLGLTMMMVSLGGCAVLKNIIPPTKQELRQQAAERKAERKRELKKECDKSDVLLSDLEKPVNNRSYAITPGVFCHG